LIHFVWSIFNFGNDFRVFGPERHGWY
jgi:hypothetical protein